MQPVPANAGRIASLDGLRAISISLVILSHLVKWKHVSLKVVGTYGDLGVQVFFVLSGFLITKLLLKEYDRSTTINLREFYVRRAFRIFPAAVVFLFAASVLYWHQIRWNHLMAALLYVANMDPSRPWIFGHLWSLSIEEQFYLLWPFALKRWHSQKAAILGCVLFATPLFRTALYAFKVRNGLTGSLPVFGDQLAIGCLLAIFEQRVPKIRGALALLLVLATVSIPWFAAITPTRTLFLLYVLRPLVDLCVAGLVLHVIQHPYRVLNWGPIVWLGQISYSIYLWQELFCSNASLHQGYQLIVPTLGCACMSYYLVERPMLRVRERSGQKANTVSRHPAHINQAPAIATVGQ